MNEFQSRQHLPLLSVESNYSHGQKASEPFTPRTARPSTVSPQLRRTLTQAWDEAQQSFQAKTNRPLTSFDPKNKDGFLNSWQRKFDQDNSEKARKSEEMKSILGNIVNGVELVGAFAAQAASAVFPPANMCFSAIDILLNAPKKISNVYDCLKLLFEEMAQFLVKFRILDRIDQKFGLDEDLLENTNRLLIVFVDICALAVPMIGGNKFWLVAAKATFLNDDSGVGGALKKFRRLTESHSNLTELVTLEEVLKSKEKSGQILESLGESNVILMSLFAANKDEKTLRVNKERLSRIEKGLFTNEERAVDIRAQRLASPLYLLQDTMHVLEAETSFQEWSKAEPSDPKLLFLSGGQGTGKTSFLQALADRFNIARNEMVQPGPSIYVASYTFNVDRARAVGKSSGAKSPVLYALRNIAFQVAEQSTRYAEHLDNILKKKKELKEEARIDELWSSLELLDFGAPDGSIMYLFFDGLEQEKEKDLTELSEILLPTKIQVRSSKEAEPRMSARSLSLRIIASGNLKTSESIEQSVPKIDMSVLNRPLIKVYAEEQMDACACFADRDPRTISHREHVLAKLPEKADGNFNVVRQKIASIHEASKNDASADELTRILDDDTSLAVSEEGKMILNQLGTGLTIQHIEQLNLLLLCIFYGKLWWKLEHLEAFFYLEFPKRSLEPLSKKIWERFQPVFVPLYSSVGIEERVQSALEQMDEALQNTSEKEQSLITMSINITNASEQYVRKFIWELNEQVMSGKFDFFASHSSAKDPKIYVNRLEGHKRFVLWYLKLLNEPAQEETKILIESAWDFLPHHLGELHKMSDVLTSSEHQLICQSLVNYFSDSFNIEQHAKVSCYSFLGPRSEDEALEAVQYWLEHPDTERHLSPNERRWVRKVKNTSAGKYGFLGETAFGTARAWLNQPGSMPSSGFQWVQWYLQKVSVSPNFIISDVALILLACKSNDQRQVQRVAIRPIRYAIYHAASCTVLRNI